MSPWRLVRRSLTHHWRIHVAVALGVMAATAVLAGALLVGDSVRGSLRQLTLERLGKIDAILVGDRFFRSQMSQELRAAEGFSERFSQATGVILFRHGTAEQSNGTYGTRRASNVLVVGCDERFWDFADAGKPPDVFPGTGQIVLNHALARELGAVVGDDIVLRLPKSTEIPADSPLGEKDNRIRGIPRLKVASIIPNRGLGRFSLTASQNLPRNAYVALETLQSPLEQEGKVNAILVSGRSSMDHVDTEDAAALDRLLQPTLADMGLTWTHVQVSGTGELEPVLNYLSLTSDRMVMDSATEQVATAALAEFGAQRVLTYLANEISRADEERSEAPGIPYSTITAVDSNRQLGPLVNDRGDLIGPLADDQIVLNSWAADDLKVEPGDRLRVTYFEPETTHGKPVETTVEFTLKSVVTIQEPASPPDGDSPAVFDVRPTKANDSHLTPEVRGITDKDSISRWNVPFELTRQVRREDDQYYKNHRLTPKAFVSLKTGQRLWGSRFGQITSLRIPVPKDVTAETIDEFRRRLSQRFLDEVRDRQANLGFNFIPIKAQGLAASRGTTPFDVLFLALSFFIIIAALLLVALLFRLGIERRASEVGLLLSMGLDRRQIGRLLTMEGTIVASIGGLLGVLGGIAYAWGMLAGLRTYWIEAIVTPFLQFHWSLGSLILGYVFGVLACSATIYLSVLQLRKNSALGLLVGRTDAPLPAAGRPPARSRKVILISLVTIALTLAVAATRLGGEAQAGAFVGAGALLLCVLLIWTWSRLRSSAGQSSRFGAMTLPWLAARNAGRNPSRSTMSMGLIASATFLIVALSSFRLAPTVSGTGGFDLIAQSSEPVFVDLNSREGREDLLGDATSLQGTTIFPLRLKSGDDASCTNLFKATQPQVLGVTKVAIDYFDNPEVPHFTWAATDASTSEEETNTWRLLEREIGDDIVPVVVDKNTAMYGLGLYGGIGQEFEYTYDQSNRVRFRVVGLLANSVLQGRLLVSESQFTKHFSDVPGYRFFLIRSASEKRASVTRVLEEALGDQGFDIQDSAEVLAGLLAVQNTYLSTFQSLGALGLLLGTIGLGAVQLRNVLERRSELALLRAAGFRRGRLAGLVMLENLSLLGIGLAGGIAAALLSVLPHMYFGDASVPLRGLAVMLLSVFAVGTMSSLLSVRATLNAPLVPALRGD